ASRRCGAVNLGGRDAGLLRVDHRLAVARQLHVVEFAVAARDAADLAAVYGDELNALASAIGRGEEQCVRLRRPGKAVHPPVEIFGQTRHAPGRTLDRHQPPAIALITGPQLRAPTDILAV